MIRAKQTLRPYPAALLLCLLGVGFARADAPSDEAVRAAITKAVPRLEASTSNYVKHRFCFSCHNHALPIMALSAAKERGFKADPAVIERQVRFTVRSFRSGLSRIKTGHSVPGGNTHAGYALAALEAAGHECDETTAALVEYLLARQRTDGSWRPLAQRPPTMGSNFADTALALQALQAYGPPADGDEADRKLRERIGRAEQKGKKWLLTSEPKDTEDAVFRLRGLVTMAAGEEVIGSARAALLKLQRDDGGWGQLPDRGSDAYATGSALVALRLAGVSPTDEACRRGVAFLLKTQHEAGGWIVETRSRPIQTFFDNGDPGGKSQFISTHATGWAVLALLEAVEEKQ